MRPSALRNTTSTVTVVFHPGYDKHSEPQTFCASTRMSTQEEVEKVVL